MSTVNAGTNALASQYNDAVLAKNYIMNSNFDLWEEATSYTNPLTVTAERWVSQVTEDGGTLPTLTHSRQQLTPGDIAKSFYFYRINTSGAGSGFGTNAFARLRQQIEFGTRMLAGASRKVTVTFYARSSIASKRLGISLSQYYGSGGSPTTIETIVGQTWTLSSSWTKYSITFTLNTLVGKTFGTNLDDGLILRFYTMWGATIATDVGAGSAESFVGAGNIDIAQVQFVIGETSLEYKPPNPGEELTKCQRYRVKIDAEDNTFATFGVGQANTTTTALIQVQLPVKMRAAPTLSTNGSFRSVYANTTVAVNAPVIERNSRLTPQLSITASSGTPYVQNDAVLLGANADSTAYLLFTAEL